MLLYKHYIQRTINTSDVTNIYTALDPNRSCQIILWYSDVYNANSDEITLISNVDHYNVSTNEFY